MGSSGKNRIENKWNVLGMQQSAQLEVLEWSASGRASNQPPEQHIWFWCHCTMLCWKWNQNLMVPYSCKLLHWISQYKFPQPLYLIHFISFMATCDPMLLLTSGHYMSEGHKFNTDHPENFNPQWPSVFVSWNISRGGSLVCCCLSCTSLKVQSVNDYIMA